MHARGRTLYDINVYVYSYERHSNLLPSEKFGRRKLYIYTHTHTHARSRRREELVIYIYIKIYIQMIISCFPIYINDYRKLGGIVCGRNCVLFI